MNRLVRDRHDKLAIWQSPNLPLVVWLISWLLTYIVPYGQLNFVFALLAFGAGFTWAWLELFNGDSYFRRGLGLFVLVSLIISRV